MKFSDADFLLYAVTDRRWSVGRTLKEQVADAITGGVTMVQLREKDLSAEKFLQEAREIREICRRGHVPFIVNDNVEIAAAIDADGVHLGQEDMSPVTARKILGSDKLIGVSVKTRRQAELAQSMGADYLGVGAVFPTQTKKDAAEVSLDVLREICAAVKIPAVAIGGIDGENMGALQHSGIVGVSVVSAIFAQADTRAAAQELKAAAIKFLGREQ